MESLVFTGFYGTGKTIVARLLSARKNLEMIDLEELKKDYNILNARTEFLNRFDYKDKIYTLDNEYIKDEEFRNKIKQKAKVIYLKGSPYTIYNNLEHEYKNHYFNESNFTEQNILDMCSKLEPLYLDLSSFTINIDYKKIENVFSNALAIYNYVNKIHCHIYFK